MAFPETTADWMEEYQSRQDACDDYERGDGCLFPGECCMPGPHDKSECHTVEMIRDFERECMSKPTESPGDRIFPFGKHKGERLRDIPITYLDWALSIDLRDDLRADIQAHLKTQAEYDAMGDAPDWKDGREEAEDWRDEA